MCFLSKLFKKRPKNTPKSTPKPAKNTPEKYPEKPKKEVKLPIPELTPAIITPEKYLMGRDKEYPLDQVKSRNMHVLLARVNKLLARFGKDRELRSGYRPGKYNTAAGGSKFSSHLSCEGIDIGDTDDELKTWLADHLEILEELDLTMEDPRYTDTWVHLQTRRVKSGRRVFIPY